MSLRTALLKSNEFKFMLCLLFLIKLFKSEISAGNFFWSEICMCMNDLRLCVLLLLLILTFLKVHVY